jgi:catechol 2,3-dioxygenase-like lactoylglutathione lyase family enzyme
MDRDKSPEIAAAVDFYGKLFGAEPAKRRPGYANFAINEPPPKLVLAECSVVTTHGLPAGSGITVPARNA